ncbi:MAG: nucleoid occlusion protein [Defluviitaleaceae bacterium]|nr:nucleoid occlusion protein [Defluviitaleaceae bacterium]MCL2240193.1 nucleoid occlusion protein [Defluviitaleaceae bacterium]
MSTNYWGAPVIANEVLHLTLDEIKPNPYQPRRFFDLARLEELAASIRAYGVLQPISVRKLEEGYELVAGERRLRACRLAGHAIIPAIAVDMGEMDSAVLAMIENLQRQDLHFFEEAEGFANLMGDYGFTQEALAVRVGKTQSTVANKVRILKLSEAVRTLIMENELTERHARALLKLKDEAAQLEVLRRVAKQGLNVRKTEDLIELMLEDDGKPPGRNTVFVPFIRDIRILTNSIKESLEMVRHSGIDSKFDMEPTDTGYEIRITLDYEGKGTRDAQSRVPRASGE